jgi:hypothetical protein
LEGKKIDRKTERTVSKRNKGEEEGRRKQMSRKERKHVRQGE